ncbi:DMT family transporter [Paenibacillus sp. YPG26]|uniref:DMT family transporter n=1 Tax=Paenibacillus sp. YPG26 TaxID=2878915 RepID=UPI00203E6E99|nr:DMT family transporter [Paenibacillus sp. YPG26]USB34135.1 DMT family transporter [Paenibacillus sp. YPG26]
MRLTRSRLAELSLLIVAMMWGCTFLMVQSAVQALPPLAFNAVRFIGAALLLAVIISVFYSQEWRLFSGKMLLHGSLLGVFLFGGYAFQTMGLLYTTTSNAGFITGLSVVMVPFLAAVLLRHRLSRVSLACALLAACGLYLLAFPGGSFIPNRGDGLVLLCAFAFALHIGFTGIYAPRYPALPLAAVQLAVTGLLSLASSLLTENLGSWNHLSNTLMQSEVLIALLVSIGPTSAFAFWIQTVSQQYTTPTRVAVIFAMEPVFAALTGVVFAGEVLGWPALIGCACILTGMIASELQPAASSVEAVPHTAAGSQMNKDISA